MQQIKLYNLMELNVKDSKYSLVLHGKTNVNTWYVLVVDNETDSIIDSYDIDENTIIKNIERGKYYE